MWRWEKHTHARADTRALARTHMHWRSSTRVKSNVCTCTCSHTHSHALTGAHIIKWVLKSKYICWRSAHLLPSNKNCGVMLHTEKHTSVPQGTADWQKVLNNLKVQLFCYVIKRASLNSIQTICGFKISKHPKIFWKQSLEWHPASNHDPHQSFDHCLHVCWHRRHRPCAP